MATYRELISLITDQVKGGSDDFSFTDAHIAFLIDKYRALLIEKKYNGKDPGSENKVDLCVKLKLKSIDKCKDVFESTSVDKLPSMIGDYSIEAGELTISSANTDRFRHALSGEFAAKTIYGTIGGDRHLKLKGLDPRMKYLNEVRITCMPASIPDRKLLCDQSEEGQGGECADSYDITIPLEEGLVMPLIDAVRKDILSTMYNADDYKNNGMDDLPDVYTLASAISRQLRNRKAK